MVTPDGSIDRRAYTFCVLEKLLEGLRRRALFVSSGEKWSNPRAKLLKGKAWESARASVCRTLELNPKPEPELKVLQKQLNQAYSQTAKNLPNNSKVKIEKDKKGKETLTISNLDKLGDPESYLKHFQPVYGLSRFSCSWYFEGFFSCISRVIGTADRFASQRVNDRYFWL